jgi:hypothetical protein
MRVAVLSLGSKVAMTTAQFGSVALVIAYFSSIEQGFYFTFVALIAIQSLLELGLSQVLVVFLAHETGQRAAPAAYTERANLIARASFLEYGKLAAAFLLIVGALGIVFFAWSWRANALPPAEWLGPWLTLVTVSALRLPLIWLEAVLEGLGWLPNVLVVRIVAHLAWLGAFWVSAHAGLGLLSLTVATVALLLASCLGHAHRHRTLRALLTRAANVGVPMDWRQETKVMRRRVSGTWIASYIISSSPIPLTLFTVGPVQAGIVGIAFQFAAVIGVITGAMIGPRISEAARLVAAHAISDYQHLLRRTMQQTLSVGALVAAVAVTLLLAGPLLQPAVASRLPTAWVAAPLLFAAVVNSSLSCVAVFARARKQEFFIRTLFAVAITTTIGTLAANVEGSIATISFLHLGAALLITMPSVIGGFRKLTLDTGHRTAIEPPLA